VYTRIAPVVLALIAAVRRPLRITDPLADVQVATRRHRRQHRCGAVTYADGSRPAVLAAAVGATRIVEVGTALGYTALCMAAAAPGASVDTIELDGEHVRQARRHVEQRDDGDRVTVHEGRAEEVLPMLDEGVYDLALFDGFTPTREVVDRLRDRLHPGGLLIVGNLILGPERALTDDLADPGRWLTHTFGETALCLKL
jgi:predicted O-methyltransferase YrrM